MSGSINFTLSVQDVVVARRVQFRRRPPSRWSMIHKAIFFALLWLVIYGVNNATFEMPTLAARSRIGAVHATR